MPSDEIQPLFDSRPDVAGWSASLNAAEWYACRTCGASVLDWRGDTTNRDRHTDWHGNG